MSEDIYTITAKTEDLPEVVALKITKGFVVHEEPISIGSGFFVQMMKLKKEDGAKA